MPVNRIYYMGYSMRKEYILKHKNNEVIYFDMDNEKYKLLSIGKIVNYDRLPFSLEYKDNLIECAIQLNAWIRGRGLSGSRKDLNDIKKLFNINEECKLIVESYGMNVTDHYWIHESDKDLKWENLNCFDNIFDEIKIGDNNDPTLDKGVKEKSPNFCVDGSIQKRWIINEKGERALLKGSRYEMMQEPFNEVIAAKLLEEFGIKNHVRYNLKRTDDNLPYSECLTMSDKNNEFINAQWILGLENYGMKYIYNHYIDICKRNNIKDAKERIDEMIALDFLIGNEDRHKGNFGIIRNSDNLQWIKIAPIFDNGNCLFFDKNKDNIVDCGIDSLGKSFGYSNRLQLNVIDYPEWYNNKGKKIIDIVEYYLKCNERMPDIVKDKVIDITKKRVDVFENIIKQKSEEIIT